MLTIIIPALNEARTIEKVVSFCLQHEYVSEVIVVDDNSDDDTAMLAARAGAHVLHSATRGKGISMQEGVQAAHNEWLLFLDADIDPYPTHTITRLAEPLFHDTADFVKGSFTRNAGRVTTLVAKPLLSIFFPSLSSFTQPLSGMIAGKKQFFQRIDFFNDYGVDIGILIDMYLMKARIQEVTLGHIENNSKSWEGLGAMSREVAKAIISKAQQQDPVAFGLADISSLEMINRAMHQALQEKISADRHMVIFDMDDTILQGRFIDTCAVRFGFTAQLADLRAQESDPLILTKRIGLFLKGISMDQLLETIHGIKMVEDFAATIACFKERGYVTGIISHSYTLVSNYVARNSGADFSIANQLEFFNGVATGEVNMPSAFFAQPESLCGHTYCKTNALQYVCERYHVAPVNCIVVGDSKEDRCIVGHAGKGVAFRTEDIVLEKIADLHIRESSFKPLLDL